MIMFGSRKYTEVETEAHKDVADAAKDLEDEIHARLMPSRETSIALTKLEEAVMWAGKSIAVNGVIGE